MTRIIVGIEVGTSKICVAVGESHSDGSVMILGIGQSISDGVRKSEIVNQEAAREAIHTAVVDAEEKAGVEIRAVYCSVTGGHIRSFNNQGAIPVLGEDEVITKEDVENVLRTARAVSLPVDDATLHTIKQSFSVDGQKGVENPIGMIGARLEAHVHVIHGVRSRLQNTVKAIKSVPLDVRGAVFNPMASALAVLTAQQKEMGALLIDLGGGTTNFIVYAGGVIRHSGVLAVGGDHVSNDIAVGLKIPINRAENLKIEHGQIPATPAMKGQMVALKQEVGLPAREISREVLCRIMELRIEETLELVRDNVAKQISFEHLGAGVFLTGGGARARGIQEVAQKIFGTRVTLGVADTVNGVRSALESPECATAIGVVKYGALSEAQQSPRSATFAERFLSFVGVRR